ncbi:hypothetical protein [Allomesorhizobium alhagi]|uniref:Uncharacterized protein n=1 Tax=Mesorhizobium alhagi CCNWXJ12-2 TaxID=1107882 RepID=H0I096_9HYPH|nr:hypothetical protein [Mesorhizobium alhagi]EHK53642.1 hypothetical protein MAXJ12_29415 [Mesorhizobium alhagi CCNWXJ12-2]
MGQRAQPSGHYLTEDDAALVKGMIARGDRQHDIAAWFGVNGGRIGEIATGYRFGDVEAAPTQLLPPPGPYLSGRQTAVLLAALSKARNALDGAEAFIRATA